MSEEKMVQQKFLWKSEQISVTDTLFERSQLLVDTCLTWWISVWKSVYNQINRLAEPAYFVNGNLILSLSKAAFFDMFPAYMLVRGTR